MSTDGSAVVVGTQLSKKQYEFWYFAADSAEGRRISRDGERFVCAVMTPNGRFVYVTIIERQRKEVTRRDEVICIGEEITRYSRSAEADAVTVSVRPGPGDTHVSICKFRRNSKFVNRFIDLATREAVHPRDLPKHDRDAVKSTDGKVQATIRIFDVIVESTADESELMRLDVDAKMREEGTLEPVGLNDNGEILVVRVERRLKRNKRTKRGKARIEGWSVTENKKVWTVKEYVDKENVVVGSECIVTLVKGRVKMHDIVTGEAVKLDRLKKAVTNVATGGDRREFWVATEHGGSSTCGESSLEEAL